MTRLRVWWFGGVFDAVTAACPFLVQSWHAWGADLLGCPAQGLYGRETERVGGVSDAMLDARRAVVPR